MTLINTNNKGIININCLYLKSTDGTVHFFALKL